MSIAFLTEHHRFPLRRPLVELALPPGWQRFTFNRVDEDCELAVVFDDLGERIEVGLPRERLAVMLSEPPEIRRYRPAYLRQFGLVLGPVDPGPGVRWLRSQSALPYFFGVAYRAGAWSVNLSLEQVMAVPPPPKTQTVSVVISAKTRTVMHRQRLAFVEALGQRIGDRLSVFGTGFTRVPDKADAILPHAYHLVLENNDIPSFWTEKTADAYLGWSLPLFSGCADLGDYFPADSFIRIDPADIEGAVAAVERVLDEQPYERRLGAIAEARRRLLGEHELGAVLQRIAAGLPADTPRRVARPACLVPNRDLGPFGTFEPKARAIARRLLKR